MLGSPGGTQADRCRSPALDQTSFSLQLHEGLNDRVGVRHDGQLPEPTTAQPLPPDALLQRAFAALIQDGEERLVALELQGSRLLLQDVNWRQVSAQADVEPAVLRNVEPALQPIVRDGEPAILPRQDALFGQLRPDLLGRADEDLLRPGDLTQSAIGAGEVVAVLLGPSLSGRSRRFEFELL